MLPWLLIPIEEFLLHIKNELERERVEEKVQWKNMGWVIELCYFARECTGKQLESNARYSAFKLKEMEQDKPSEPKALLSVDSMVNWSDHEESADDNAS
ncbi:hypothetical protein Tco_0869684 [Tanacetum coccineum]